MDQPKQKHMKSKLLSVYLNLYNLLDLSGNNQFLEFHSFLQGYIIFLRLLSIFTF